MIMAEETYILHFRLSLFVFTCRFMFMFPFFYYLRPFSVGLCVDFCAHIVHGFLTGKGTKGRLWQKFNIKHLLTIKEILIVYIIFIHFYFQMRESSTLWRILRRQWWMVHTKISLNANDEWHQDIIVYKWWMVSRYHFMKMINAIKISMYTNDEWYQDINVKKKLILAQPLK